MRLKENERIGLSHCEDGRQAGHAAFVEEAIHCGGSSQDSPLSHMTIANTLEERNIALQDA